MFQAYTPRDAECIVAKNQVMRNRIQVDRQPMSGYALKSMDQLPLFSPSAVSVSELTRYIREVLESDSGLQNIWVRGEVSNFSRPSSGHLYFTIKDQGAALKCVMWRSAAGKQSYLPKDGAAVQVHGAVGVYEVGGQYQLYADIIRPAGEGALFLEFMRLKARLEAEGLFDPSRKRPIPRQPQRIGIVTSPTGAALRDMLKTIARRYPIAEVVLAPTPVQGDDAPAGIAAALAALQRLDRAPEVIILARGGGSIEDLWAFNDEKVALAIAASKIPTITGVGHETDFTIADFIADLRAPTPTAAAELATPDRLDLLKDLEDWLGRLQRAAQDRIAGERWALADLQRRLAAYSPAARLRSEQQYLDELIARAGRSAAHDLELKASILASLSGRLEALNPLAVLQRGYALASRLDGGLIARADQVSLAENFHLRFSDRTIRVQSVSGPFAGTEA